jgi:hypothetical protein
VAAAREWIHLLIDRIYFLVFGFDNEHANDSSTTAAMYATATAMDAAPMAGAKAGEDE